MLTAAQQRSIADVESDSAVEGLPVLGLTAEQQERRRQSIGASEIAAIIGKDKYNSPLTVWMRKTGRLTLDEPSEASEWGLRLESVIARKYAEVAHAVMLSEIGTVVSPREPWMSATPDRIALLRNNERRDVQIKNRSAWLVSEWGESGTDQIPVEVAAQVHWELLVLRDAGHAIDVAAVAVLLGGNQFRCYELGYDAQIADDMRAIGWQFWHDYVLADRMPPIDGSEQTTKHLARLFAKHTDVLRQATVEEDQLLRELRELRRQREEYEECERAAINKLKAAIGEDAGLEGPSGKATWKATKASTVVDWASAFLELRNALALHTQNDKAIGALIDRAVEQWTTEKAGVRRFLPTWPKVGIVR